MGEGLVDFEQHAINSTGLHGPCLLDYTSTFPDTAQSSGQIVLDKQSRGIIKHTRSSNTRHNKVDSEAQYEMEKKLRAAVNALNNEAWTIPAAGYTPPAYTHHSLSSPTTVANAFVFKRKSKISQGRSLHQSCSKSTLALYPLTAPAHTPFSVLDSSMLHPPPIAVSGSHPPFLHASTHSFSSAGQNPSLLITQALLSSFDFISSSLNTADARGTIHGDCRNPGPVRPPKPFSTWFLENSELQKYTHLLEPSDSLSAANCSKPRSSPGVCTQSEALDASRVSKSSRRHSNANSSTVPETHPSAHQMLVSENVVAPEATTLPATAFPAATAMTAIPAAAASSPASRTAAQFTNNETPTVLSLQSTNAPPIMHSDCHSSTLTNSSMSPIGLKAYIQEPPDSTSIIN